MKKFLIAILIILLGIMTYMLMFKNIKIGGWKSTNIEELKKINDDLELTIKSARELNEQQYTEQVELLDKSVKNMKSMKENYESKMRYFGENIDVGTVQIKNYKIEYLWTVIENYAKDRNVWIQLDVVDTGGSNLYNLEITVKGAYINITDFIYDIEKNDTFDFNIEEFKITPTAVEKQEEENEEEKTDTVVVNSNTLQATFTIKNIQIEFD